MYHNIMGNNDTASKGGISAVGVVQIVFIILKATHTGVIGTWPWWKVMLPIICSTGLICFAMCMSISCICFITQCDKDKDKDKNKSNIVEVLIDPENQKALTAEVLIE
jgi:hypothetical protein